MSLLDSTIDFATGLSGILSNLLLDPAPEKLIDIIGVHDAQTLLVRGFGLMTIIKIEGSYGAMGPDEFVRAKYAVNDALKSKLGEGSKHTIKIVFESDPDMAADEINQNYSSIRQYLRGMNLDLEDLLDEKRDANLEYVQKEACWLAFYTHPSKASDFELETIEGAGIGATQPNMQADKLALVHGSMIKSIVDALSTQLRVTITESEAVIAEVYRCINGNGAHRTTKFQTLFQSPDAKEMRLNQLAHLPERKIPLSEKEIVTYLREINRDNDKSLEAMLPPPLADQLIASGCYDPGNGCIISGSRIYAPVGVNAYGRDIKDFDALIRSMRQIPFRIAFTIKPDGLTKSALEVVESVLASVGSLLNKKMKIRQRAWARIEENKLTDPAISLSITAATWAPLERRIDAETGKPFYTTELIDKRVQRFKTALNDWGSMHAEDCVGDGLECLLSTFPGLIGYHIAPACPMPLTELPNLLPVTRVASEWDKGTMTYRTDDGKVIYADSMSELQASEVAILIGDMGSGKSGQLTNLNLGFVIKPSANQDLPILRGIDFGFSQKGLIDGIRDGLPEDQKHRAVFEKYSGTADQMTNPGDLILGDRYPLPFHRGFLVNLLCAATESISDFGHHSGLCGALVDHAYKLFSDEDGNPQAKRYRPHVDTEIDLFIDQHDIPVVDGVTTWYELMDLLFLKGNPRLATKAQRQAVPTLMDYLRVASEQEITKAYAHEHHGMPITESFKVALMETLKNIPMLAGVSTMDISQSPICVVDLKDILPSGEQSKQGQATSAIIFLAVLRMLIADFFTDDKLLPPTNSIYYKYHEERIRKIMSSNKRLFIDEKHRLNSIFAANEALDGIAKEGRKFGVSLIMGSQLLSDHSKAISTLATAVYIHGSSSMEEIQNNQKKYELSDYHAKLIMNLQKPSKKGAEFFVRYVTKSRRYCMKLLNTEGPMHLCMIATNKDDRAVREGLAKVLSSNKLARQAYAKEFPGGSVTGELNRRLKLQADGLYKSHTGDITKDIIFDIATKVSQTKKAA